MAVFDSGNAETEALLIDTEYEIQEIYDRAAKETQKKLEDYLDGFQRRDAQKQALVDSGKMSESEYATWRKNQMLTGQRWNDMVKTLTDDHVNADKIAMSVVREHLPDAYAINANYGTYEIEKGTSLDTMFTLYDRQSVERLVRDKPDLLPPAKVDIPADKRWNKQHIRNEITQSILQGDSIPNVAKRLQRVTDMDHRAAVRNARTAMTGAQNGGRVDSYKRAEAMGIKLKQQWLATLDNRTRHEHRQLDGQAVRPGEPFKIGREEIRFPGDPQAAPHLIYNCRCTLIADLEGFENDPKDLSLRYSERLGGMSYEEWKKEKSSPASGTSVGSMKTPIRPKKSNFDNEQAYMDARDAYRAEKEIYNKKMQELIDNTIKAGKITSKEEALEWAKEAGIEIPESFFDEITINSISAIRPAVDEMLKRFPEVRSFSYEFDGEIHTSSFRIGASRDGLMSAGGGISLNPMYFGNGAEEYGVKDGLEGIMAGHLVYGDGSFSTLVRHEYGHNVQNYIEFKMADKYHYHTNDWRKNFETFSEYEAARDAYFDEKHKYDSELMSLAGLRGSSEYSNTNSLELFAEGFAEWSSGGTSEFAKAFGKFFKRWY